MGSIPKPSMGKTCEQKNKKVRLKKEVVVKIEFTTPSL